MLTKKEFEIRSTGDGFGYTYHINKRGESVVMKCFEYEPRGDFKYKAFICTIRPNGKFKTKYFKNKDDYQQARRKIEARRDKFDKLRLFEMLSKKKGCIKRGRF